MNVISWNCRGTGAKGFTSLIKDMCKEYDASLVFLLETHSSGVKARRQAQKMGLNGMFIIDSLGQAGGLWCLWNDVNWKIYVIEHSDQYVHMKVSWKNASSWFITAVYANPRFARRHALWEDLGKISDTMDGEWMVIGDFNAITNSNERKGGAQNFATRGMRSFCDMIQDCDLLDVGFQGSPFTWKHGRLHQRMDRVLINVSWRLKFQSASIFHLPFFKSDHKALLVQFKCQRKTNKRRRPFRFLASWLTHTDFPNLMANIWPINAQWCSHFKHFQSSVSSWNQRVFGNIFVRKKKLIRGLEEVDHKLLANPSHGLEEEQNNLWREYEKVLAQEELLWYQKSRSRWLHFGDRNTRFFHGVTAVRRKKNTYEILQDENGSWVGDPRRIENIVTKYYKELFSDDGMREQTCITGVFPKLSNEELHAINREITRGDILNVISHMGPFKAPGPDGLQAVFLKS